MIGLFCVRYKSFGNGYVVADVLQTDVILLKYTVLSWTEPCKCSMWVSVGDRAEINPLINT